VQTVVRKARKRVGWYQLVRQANTRIDNDGVDPCVDDVVMIENRPDVDMVPAMGL